MQKSFYKLIALLIVMSTANLYGNYTCIITGTLGTGVKKAGIMSAKDDWSANLKNCTLTPLAEGQGLVNVMWLGTFDASFICIRDVVDWFAIGGIGGFGFACDMNILSSLPNLTIHEPFRAQLGIATKVIDTVISLGIRAGYRTSSIAAGKKVQLVGKEEWNGATADSFGFGWFGQVVRLIPLEDEKWSIVLFSEMHGDLYPAAVKFSSTSQTADYHSSQLAVRFGIGIGYCASGSVYP